MKVSVAMCTFNGEKYIKEQIESIINQTVKPDEIVLCDDNSSDNTLIIAKKLLRDSGIPYLIEVNPQNLGVVKNFEKTIGLTTGEVIFLCDQDDVWSENKVELMIKNFEEDPSCVLVFSNAFIVDKKRNRAGKQLWESLSFSIMEFGNRNFLDILLNRCVVTGAAMAIRRKLYEASIPFNEMWVHDGWLAINACFFGNVIAVDKSLIEYRQHGNNVIGAQNTNLIQKANQYILNIRKLAEIRENRYKRYSGFYFKSFKNIDDLSKNKISQCIGFWNDMNSLKTAQIKPGLKIIFKNISNYNYSNYYTGFRGAIRDIIYLLFFREGKVC